MDWKLSIRKNREALAVCFAPLKGGPKDGSRPVARPNETGPVIRGKDKRAKIGF